MTRKKKIKEQTQAATVRLYLDVRFDIPIVSIPKTITDIELFNKAIGKKLIEDMFSFGNGEYTGNINAVVVDRYNKGYLSSSALYEDKEPALTGFDLNIFLDKTNYYSNKKNTKGGVD